MLDRSDASTTSANTARQRICILSEDLSGAPDEGVKKFALTLARVLQPLHEVLVLGTQSRPAFPAGRLARAPRSFLSLALYAALAKYDPHVLIYASRPSTTFFSFVRSRLLKAYRPHTTVVLLGLQGWREHTPVQRRLIRYLCPDLVLVGSADSKAYFASLGCRTAMLPSGVDVDVFAPVTPQRRRELRLSYGLQPDVPVALHVGHLKSGRGISMLGELARRGGCQVVLVTSSSTPVEETLADELRSAGVTVLTTFQPHIEELFQLASCYVFPVTSGANAIDVPLSVLEALACDLPVVTTPFGGLPGLFGTGPTSPGLVFAASPEALIEETLRLCRAAAQEDTLQAAGAASAATRSHDQNVETVAAAATTHGGTRALALPFAWESIAMRLLEQALTPGEPPCETSLQPTA